MNEPDVSTMFRASADRLREIATTVADTQARLDVDRIARMLDGYRAVLERGAAAQLQRAVRLDALLQERRNASLVPASVRQLAHEPEAMALFAPGGLDALIDELVSGLLASSAPAADPPAHVKEEILALLREETWVVES